MSILAFVKKNPLIFIIVAVSIWPYAVGSFEERVLCVLLFCAALGIYIVFKHDAALYGEQQKLMYKRKRCVEAINHGILRSYYEWYSDWSKLLWAAYNRKTSVVWNMHKLPSPNGKQAEPRPLSEEEIEEFIRGATASNGYGVPLSIEDWQTPEYFQTLKYSWEAHPDYEKILAESFTKEQFRLAKEEHENQKTDCPTKQTL
jgi:hypothetical protein